MSRVNKALHRVWSVSTVKNNIPGGRFRTMTVSKSGRAEGASTDLTSPEDTKKTESSEV